MPAIVPLSGAAVVDIFPHAGAVARPFVQTDWPLYNNGVVPARLDQTWTWSYNLNLIGQDSLTPQNVT